MAWEYIPNTKLSVRPTDEVLPAARLTITESWVEPFDAQGQHAQVDGARQQVARDLESEGAVEVKLS